jgi:preprotein translocase subunit YajC
MGDVNMAALEEAVAKVETVAGSAVTLIEGLVAEVAAVKDDPVAVQAALDRATAAADRLAAAVAANTPAAPEPTV